MATAASLLIALGLAVIPYNFGSHRWSSKSKRTLRGVGLMMLVVFVPWFVLSVSIGASRSVVPVAMAVFCVAYAAGHRRLPRRVKSRR